MLYAATFYEKKLFFSKTEVIYKPLLEIICIFWLKIQEGFALSSHIINRAIAAETININIDQTVSNYFKAHMLKCELIEVLLDYYMKF